MADGRKIASLFLFLDVAMETLNTTQMFWEIKVGITVSIFFVTASRKADGEELTRRGFVAKMNHDQSILGLF